MNIFKFNAKVLLTSEDQMESDERYDMGNIAKSKEWVWRNVAVPVEEVYKIIEFNRTKSIVQLHDEEKILVNEPFDKLFERWESFESIVEIPEEDENTNETKEKEDEENEGDVLK